MSNVSPASVRAAAAINACAAAGRNASGVLSSAWSAIRPPAVFQSSVEQAEDAVPPTSAACGGSTRTPSPRSDADPAFLPNPRPRSPPLPSPAWTGPHPCRAPPLFFCDRVYPAPPWPHPVRARIRAPAFEEIRNGPAWHRQIIHFHRLFHKGGIDRLRKAIRKI